MQLGDSVKWGNPEKHGVIVAVVRPRARADETFRSLIGKFKMVGLYDGGYRDHESYLVALPQGPRGGKRPTYWPLVKQLILEVGI